MGIAEKVPTPSLQPGGERHGGGGSGAGLLQRTVLEPDQRFGNHEPTTGRTAVRLHGAQWQPWGESLAKNMRHNSRWCGGCRNANYH